MDKKETFEPAQQSENLASTESEHKMAQNPNPRANENIKAASFDKDEDATGVGSEITDGEAG